MKIRLSLVLATLAPIVLSPTVSWAAGCGDYPLTQAQSDYLQLKVPDIIVPTGEVPFVQRCDVNADSQINNLDLDLIRAHKGEPAAHPDDPMDWDGNGEIHGRDVGGCASSCTGGGSGNGCAVKENTAEEEGFEAAQQMNIVGEAGACFQLGDFDADGAQDFIGIFEYTGSATRGNNWHLNVVILTEDAGGNVQHVEYPYTGQLTAGNGDLLQHLSLQPAGVVNLNPRSITIDHPGVVSYRNGEPKTLYYFSGGVLSRAFFGVND